MEVTLGIHYEKYITFSLKFGIDSREIKRYNSWRSWKQKQSAAEMNICGCGGTGRRVRLRGVWETVWVQVPSTAPEKKSSLSIGQRRFLFNEINPLRDLWNALRAWNTVRNVKCTAVHKGTRPKLNPYFFWLPLSIPQRKEMTIEACLQLIRLPQGL